MNRLEPAADGSEHCSAWPNGGWEHVNPVPHALAIHDALKRLKVILLSEHVHLPGRSVQDVINKPARCYSRCPGHNGG